MRATRRGFNMKKNLSFLLFFIFCFATANAKYSDQKFDRSAYYSIMASGKLSDINEELNTLSTAAINEKEAYEGALLMRKAGLVKIPAEKLKFFKRGRIKLETALLNENNNVEYHFLRLIIQEHAPKIVKYRAAIAADKEHIKRSYKTLSPVVQQAIMDYSKSSKILHPQDL